MKYQPKVSTTQKYSDSQGEHIVHKGKLIKIKVHGSPQEHDIVLQQIEKGQNEIGLNVRIIRPIIISETEEIEVGDWVYHTSRKQIFKVHHFEHQMNKLIVPEDEYELSNDEIKVLVSDCHKILALPEHFSDKHLQAIINGKMKDGDEVLIKCDWGRKRLDGILKKIHLIYLDSQNHITLFPAKQSLEEEIELSWLWFKPHTPKENREAIKLAFITAFKAGAKWAKKNNY